MGHVTADKQTPSALDYLGHMKEAVAIEKRLQKQPPRPLKDLLNSLVATYNKMTTSKRHRIETGKKNLIYNMWLSSNDAYPLDPIINTRNRYDIGVLYCILGKMFIAFYEIYIMLDQHTSQMSEF